MSENSTAYLSAPILPTLGLGGIQVGDKRVDVVEILGLPTLSRLGAVAIEETELLEYPGVAVCLQRDRVWGVMALAGYAGRTPNGAYVGMPWRELLRVAPRILFHEGARTWYEPASPTLDYDVVRPWNENPEGGWVEEIYEVMMPDQAIVDSISVYAESESPLTMPNGSDFVPWS